MACPFLFCSELAVTSKSFYGFNLYLSERLVYIGLRNIDAGEKKILREHSIKAFRSGQVWYWKGRGDHVNPTEIDPFT